MEATLLRILSLLRRTRVYYNNSSIIIYMSSPHWSYYDLDRFSTVPAISSKPEIPPEPAIHGSDLPESTRHDSYRPCWPSPSDSWAMLLYIYPERAGIPGLERDCHSSLGSSEDISISHSGVSRGHRNVPLQSDHRYTPTPDSSGLRGFPNRTRLSSDQALPKYLQAAGCAALLGSSSLKEHLPSASSIYTTELRAIVLGFKLICKSPKEHFVICTDSLSCSLAIRNLKQDHHLLHKICIHIFIHMLSHISIKLLCSAGFLVM